MSPAIAIRFFLSLRQASIQRLTPLMADQTGLRGFVRLDEQFLPKLLLIDLAVQYFFSPCPLPSALCPMPYASLSFHRYEIRGSMKP